MRDPVLDDTARYMGVAFATSLLGACVITLLCALLGISNGLMITACAFYGFYCGFANPLYPYITKETHQ